MKVFCIGFNKTGTSSLNKFMTDHDFISPSDDVLAHNLESYISGNYETFEHMIKNRYSDCNWFQDVPFSLPNMYKFLDTKFESSKFILTIRNNSEDWYNSLINYHKKQFPFKFQTPKKVKYIYDGWLYDLLTKGFNAPLHDPYNKKILIDEYEKHIKNVKKYFEKSDKLLIMNLNDNKVSDLGNFLDIKIRYDKFPHLNQS